MSKNNVNFSSGNFYIVLLTKTDSYGIIIIIVNPSCDVQCIQYPVSNTLSYMDYDV